MWVGDRSEVDVGITQLQLMINPHVRSHLVSSVQKAQMESLLNAKISVFFSLLDVVSRWEHSRVITVVGHPLRAKCQARHCTQVALCNPPDNPRKLSSNDFTDESAEAQRLTILPTVRELGNEGGMIGNEDHLGKL